MQRASCKKLFMILRCHYIEGGERTSPFFRSFAFRELLNDSYDALAQLGLAYLREGPRQCQPLGRREKFARIVVSLCAALGIRGWYLFEEKRYWYF